MVSTESGVAFDINRAARLTGSPIVTKVERCVLWISPMNTAPLFRRRAAGKPTSSATISVNAWNICSSS